MWDMITKVFNNIGMSMPDTLLLMVIIGGLVFYAKDFKLGLALQFFMTALLFVWFYTAGYAYVNTLIVMLMTAVILSLDLFFISKGSSGGFV